MSGRKQHIVPQFIQKNFSIKSQVWVYTNNKIYSTNIKDNFAERDFYSSPNNSSVDDHITSKEGIYSNCLQQLLTSTTNITNNLNKNFVLMEFISHLIFRTKEMQNNLIEKSLSDLFKIIQTITLSDFQSSFTRKFKKNKRMLQIIKDIPNNLPLWEKNLSELKTEIENKLKTEQREALKDVNIKHLHLLQNFNYKIIDTDIELILSDNILFCVQSNNQIQSMLDEHTETLYFPISSNKILILFKTNKDTLGIEDINKNMSSISSEKFISKNKKFQKLQKNINTKSWFSICTKKYKNNKRKILHQMMIMFKFDNIS